MNVKNARTLPKKYYGLHFCEGVARYADSDTMLFINSDTAKKMDATYVGKPVFVGHVDDYQLQNIEAEADGWVVRSFYNPTDGKHWCEFLAVTDKANDAIAAGFRLSNSYLITESGAGGEWHNVPYTQEVLKAEYDHMAIVDNPRYEESIILTPEAFKEYNENKEAELLKIANSKGDSIMFFKKQKVDNSKDLEQMSVVLPKSKIEKTVIQIINEMDEMEEKKKNKQYANEDHMVKIGENEMSVKELVEKYNAISHEEAKEVVEEIEEKAEVLEEHEEASIEEDMLEKELDNESPNKAMADNEDEEESEEDKKKKEKDNKKKNSKENFDALKKAQNAPTITDEAPVYMSSVQMMKLGQSRYGSK